MSDMQLENVVSIPDGIIDGKSISVCSSQDKVFKDECMYCFKTPFSDGGLFVCLKTFVGFCLEHVKEYVNRQSKYIFLNIIKKTVEKEIQEPLEKISKLAIGIAGGVGVDNNEVITEYYLAIIQDSTIKLVRMESISDSTILASMESAIRNDGVKLQERINAGVSEWDGEARILTKHANIEQVNNGKIIPNSGWVCEVDGCDLNENLWLNLVDGTIRCGRSQYIKEGVITKGNNHMKEYYETTKYPLVLKLGTIKDGDGDLYSYDEDENVFDPNLSKHLAHFGIDINKVEKTEKSTLEMELDMNQQWEWSKCQEGGVALENVYGPNFTGMINIGSSCYMNSVIQMLCISKRFKECFFDNASEILYTPLPQDTHNDVYCQFVKVFTSLLSGKFSNSNGQDQGIRPTQFRKIMGKGHPEFSTSKQQDAEEYLRHIFEVIEKGRNLPLNPVKDFQMNLETRLEDGASGRVKYSNRDEVIISLPIPLDKTEEIFNDDTQTRRKKVKLNDCIEAAFGKDVISGFKSPVTKEQTNAYNSIKLNNMPNYILFQARKFEITPEFTIRKMDIDIDVCENINLEKFRAKGKSPEEELLPEDCGGDDECNQDILHNLLDMGFSENACKRACVAVKNSNVGEAATWLMEHMDDRDINDPIVNTSSKNGLKQFDENIISQLTSLGFSSYQANYALNQTGSDDVNQAAEWLFINNESIPPPPSSISSSSTTNNVDNKKEYDDGEGNYKLVAFISHMGTSPHSGHYVVHIKRDSTWYIYNDEKVAVSQNPPFSLENMGTPTPRKFSEKIALMERKQNEDQELFHSIMRDVKAITSSNSTSNPTTPLPSTQSSQPTTNFVFQNNNQGYSNINNIHQQNSNNISSYQGIPINSNTLQLQNNVWNGVGGSLPNVHDPFFHQNQTIPQNTLNAFYINPNNNYNQSITYSQIRSRSPGAPNHYHPYSNGINPLRGRSQCERQNTFDGGETSFPSISNQLAPPDMHHWKARSDSAINVHPHSNYFSDMMNNHHLGGNLPNYEQFHNIYHPNNLMNNGNLIEDSINPNNIPYNCQTSTTSSRQQSPIPQTNYCNNFPIENCNTSPINSPQYPPTTTYSTVSSPVCYTPSLGSPNSVSQDSPTNNTFPQHTNLSCIQQQSTSTEYSCQQQTTSTIHGNSILQNHVQSPINNPICIPTSQIQMINMTQQQQQQSSCQQSQTSINPQNHMMINQNGSHLPCQQQQSPIVTYPPSYPQTLIGPYSNIPQESSFQQSSPESPSTSIICDNNKSSTSPRGNNTYPKKKFSNSPDPMDIPNIVLTGADGELDSFQNLNLSNENFDFTSTNPNTLINCGGMMRNGGEIIITTGGETTSSYHNITNNPSMRDLQSSIIITRDFIN